MAVVAAAMLVAGCGGSSRDGGGRATTSPSAAVKAPPWHTVRFRASDGVRLHGRFTPAARGNAPAIVLVHQYRGGPRQWDPLVPVLHRAGYATLAYASRSAAELDETRLARDVIGAVSAVRRERGVDRRRIGLVGASIGATTVAWYLGGSPAASVRVGVGLSPVESPALIRAGMSRRFHPRDLLLIADRREIGDSQGIRSDAHGRGIRTWTAPVAGHGVALLPDAPVRERLLGWLRSRLSP
jgi:alpha-beta hydrolase superfamily lysophospholipase